MPSAPPRWAPPLAAAVATGAFALWNPPLRDLAAHTFRAEYFEHHGFAIWNGTWYGGHYLLAYSVLFPPLAALLSPVWVGALRRRSRARICSTAWCAPAGASGRAGRACGSRRSAPSRCSRTGGWCSRSAPPSRSASLRALQLGRTRSRRRLRGRRGAGEPGGGRVPCAGLRRGGSYAARRGGCSRRWPRRWCRWRCSACCSRRAGEFPFWFSAWWPLALFCMLALLATRGHRGRPRRARGDRRIPGARDARGGGARTRSAAT